MNFNFCPYCGKAALEAKDQTTYVCNECGHHVWNNPKAAVGVIFMRANELLFSRRGEEPFKGSYDFPGGFLDYGEGPTAACVREIAEETTVKITPADLQLIAAYTVPYRDEIWATDLLYVITKWEGEFKAQDDSAALEWKPISFLHDPLFARDYDGLEDILKSL